MEMREAVVELLGSIVAENSLIHDDVISIVLTSTPDLRSGFPAAGARDFGFTDVPLLCAQEIDVVGAMPRVVRLMLHAYMTVPASHVRHMYLRGAQALRQDLAQ